MDSLPCPGTATVTDYDGNTYSTVQIGDQCWMRENLRTTHYANGNTIPLGVNTSTSSTIAYRFYPNSNESNVPTYGYLYNWPAVMGGSASSNSNPSGVQGICPTGWHVPSHSEWTQLINYVSGQTAYVCGNNSNNIAKALASTTYWMNSNESCAVGNTPADNNATGFAAIPADRTHSSILGNFAYFWSSTEESDGDNDAYDLSLCYSDAHVSNVYADFKLFGFSVRCLRNQ